MSKNLYELGIIEGKMEIGRKLFLYTSFVDFMENILKLSSREIYEAFLEETRENEGFFIDIAKQFNVDRLLSEKIDIEGKIEGKIEGRIKGKIEIIKNLRREGYDDAKEINGLGGVYIDEKEMDMDKDELIEKNKDLFLKFINKIKKDEEVYEKGKSAGRDEGEFEIKLEIAEEMIKRGRNEEFIHRVTGVSKEDIVKLKHFIILGK